MPISIPGNERSNNAAKGALVKYSAPHLPVFDRKAPDIVITDIILTNNDADDFTDMIGRMSAEPAQSWLRETAPVYLKAAETALDATQPLSRPRRDDLLNAVEGVLRHDYPRPELSLFL